MVAEFKYFVIFEIRSIVQNFKLSGDKDIQYKMIPSD